MFSILSTQSFFSNIQRWFVRIWVLLAVLLAAIAAPAAVQAQQIGVSRDATSIANGGTDAQGSSIPMGQQQKLTYTITNSDSSTDLTISSVQFENETNISSFLVSDDPDTTVSSGGGTTTFEVTYKVTQSIDFSFDIVINSNDPNISQYRITVSGSGVNAPEIDVSRVATPSNIAIADGAEDDLGNILVGQRTVQYTIANTGTSVLNVASIESENPSNISSVQLSSGTALQTVNPDSSITLTVTYTVSGTGPFDFDLVITSSDGDEATYNIKVKGNGVVPEIGLSRAATPNDIIFSDGDNDDQGSGLTAGSQQTLTYTIGSTGTGELTINDIAVGTNSEVNVEGVQISGTYPDTVSAGNGKLDFDVDYTPSAEGDFEFDIVIDNNDADEGTFTITIKGSAEGDPEIDIKRGSTSIGDGATDNLGSIPAGPEQTLTYTIDNIGRDTLTVSSVSVVGTGSNVSSVQVTNPPTSDVNLVPLTGTMTFTVTYIVDSIDTFSFDLQILSNDGSEATYDIKVSGTGEAAPEINVRSLTTSTDIGDGGTDIQGADTFVGPQQTVQYQIQNTGTGALTISGINIAGTPNNVVSTPEVTSAQSFPFGVEADGGTATFTVTYTISSVAVFGFDLQILSNDTNENPYDIQVAGSGVDPAPTITRTKGIIHNAMLTRLEWMASNNPSLEDRLSNRDGNNRRGSVDVTSSGVNASFSASLRSFQPQQSSSQMNAGAGLDASEFKQTGWDIWLEGTFSVLENQDTQSNFALLHTGVDYKVNDSLVLGALGQIDISSYSSNAPSPDGYSVKGVGWMVGPFVVAKLGDTIILESRVAWGTSENDISPLLTYTDEFNTQRFMAAGRVTGDFDIWGGVTISPHVGVQYFLEEQEEYIDSNGLEIPGQMVEIGQLDFGPSVSKIFDLRDGSSFKLRLGVEGIWNFYTPGFVELTTGLEDDPFDGLRGRFEMGGTFDHYSGSQIRLEGFYDGFGQDDYESYGGSLRLNMPF